MMGRVIGFLAFVWVYSVFPVLAHIPTQATGEHWGLNGGRDCAHTCAGAPSVSQGKKITELKAIWSSMFLRKLQYLEDKLDENKF